MICRNCTTKIVQAKWVFWIDWRIETCYDGPCRRHLKHKLQWGSIIKPTMSTQPRPVLVTNIMLKNKEGIMNSKNFFVIIFIIPLFFTKKYIFFLIFTFDRFEKKIQEPSLPAPKIQQIKMLVTCQRFGEIFLFGLI